MRTVICFLVLFVLIEAFDKAVLKSGLQSIGGQLNLFSQWQQRQHTHYSKQEEKFRFRVFRRHLQEIVAINEAQDSYELDANFMAALTEEEQQRWYGVNVTALVAEENEIEEDDGEDDITLSSGLQSGSKNWRQEGKITAVKNQGSCGSCWAFAAIGSFEGHYAVQTGALKRFSEQEFLDCTYEQEGRDGCQGGWYWDSYRILQRSQHLALERDYPYQTRDGQCRTDSTRNGMVAAKMMGTIRPRRSNDDASLVRALVQGPVAMAFSINGGFNYYRNGVLTIPNCGTVPHHAMTITGYTPSYFEIKNSWGSTWGLGGYVRFDRSIRNMCGILNYLAYPELEKTGEDEDGVMPTEEEKEPVVCIDKDSRCPQWTEYCFHNQYWQYMGIYCQKSCKTCGCQDGLAEQCNRWKDMGYCSMSQHKTFFKVVCKKSCNLCDEDEGDSRCPSGLVFCNGECRHEHLC